ncbi:hypothetical protein I203_101001 [Kwoniella mangroviensis CBS 8507]|uniref:uncharacterized protein n=1 Tax=Kwoniella mangroviensis CBS 8507 TaxID=1296122 RepID=UPI00080CDEC2|nr:uncharacterized protein I203_02640 [Kwoniella mangroviensis CBS 8507]OCF67981.1 hypothetical protein I203_02640 [Kwoniella mangroviensis CBS 8507]
MASDDNHTDGSNYGYTPSPAWCLAFIVLFSVSAAVHSYQAFRYKYWIIYPTLVLGALVEVLGWSGRYWSSQNVTLLTPFLMQISTLIMAPVFFSAYDYVVLGMAINRLGPQYSLLRPKYYFATFITADIISLVLQAIGGGKASSSAAEGAPTQSATNIMVAGIIFQLVSMGVFIGLGVDFLLRATSEKPYAFRLRQIENNAVKKVGVEVKVNKTEDDLEAQKQNQHNEHEHIRAWWILLIGVGISSTMILIRGIYRSIELTQGWTGHLMTTEMYQNILDALMMLIAVGIYNFIHPGYLLPRKRSWREYH